MLKDPPLPSLSFVMSYKFDQLLLDKYRTGLITERKRIEAQIGELLINAFRIAGILFLFIIVMNVASVSYGNELMSDLNVETKLLRIYEDPTKFKTGIGLAVVEHLAIIALAVTLFIAFSPFDKRLGWVWLVARSLEGFILVYTEIRVWELLSLAERYSVAGSAEQSTLIAMGQAILQTKNTGFLLASVLFGVGTMMYSYLFVTHGVAPLYIGRAGIIIGFFWGVSNGLSLVTSSFLVLTNLSGLAVLVFELLLGGWLLLYSNVIS